MKQKILILIDGSNVAFNRRCGKKAMLENIDLMMLYLEDLEKGHEIEHEFLVDANLRHIINDDATLQHLISENKINECPVGIKADEFIMEYFYGNEETTIIISNDRFKEYKFNANDRLFRFMIINDKIIIPRLKEFVKKNCNEKRDVLEEIEMEKINA